MFQPFWPSLVMPRRGRVGPNDMSTRCFYGKCLSGNTTNAWAQACFLNRWSSTSENMLTKKRRKGSVFLARSISTVTTTAVIVIVYCVRCPENAAWWRSSRIDEEQVCDGQWPVVGSDGDEGRLREGGLEYRVPYFEGWMEKDIGQVKQRNQ